MFGDTQHLATETNKPSGAFDFHDTLGEFAPAWVAFNNHDFGTNLEVADLTHYFFSPELLQIMACTKEEIMHRLDVFFSSKILMNEVRPVEGAQDTVSSVQEEYNLLVITSPSEKYKALTSAWLREHFPGEFDNGAFSLVFHGGEGRNLYGYSANKAEICNLWDVEFMVDDLPYYSRQCAAVGRKSIMFASYPWNQAEFLGQGVTYCETMPIVTKELLGE